jgi:hypothetical protein
MASKPNRRARWSPGTIIAALTLCMPLLVQAQLSCGPLPSGGYGPYDYRTDKDKLDLVEKFHFTAPVESLIRGATGKIGGDLEYTLDRFPNHHRALIAVMRLSERTKSLKLEAMTYPVECYFERALRFRNDDTVVRGLYALFLGRLQRRDDAARQLEIASNYAKDNPFAHHSIGMVYLDLQMVDKAVEQAQRASELGMGDSPLIKRLQADGKWPAAAMPAEPAASIPGKS